MSTDRTGLESIVQEGSAFETIQRRLKEQGGQLREQVSGLNQAREEVFGSAGMNVLGRARVRTENNAIARDVVRLGDKLLFGFNLQLGLRKSLAVEDVFRLYHLNDGDSGFEMTEAAIEGSFLTDARFATDFRELQQYYNTATLSQLVILKGMLLMAFRIGDKLDDLRVFRWELKPDGNVNRYVDNRGERDLTFPDRFSFPWKTVGRDSQVQGRSPHLNIADTLFVDNLRGNITFKVENNTATGEGIYQDAVESDSQSWTTPALTTLTSARFCWCGFCRSTKNTGATTCSIAPSARLNGWMPWPARWRRCRTIMASYSPPAITSPPVN